MSPSRRLGIVALLVVVVIVLGLWWLAIRLPGPGFPAVELDRSRPRPQGDFLVSAFPEPTDLRPLAADEAVVRRWILRFTHDALMDLDPATGALRPALAEAAAARGDGSYAVRLRAGLQFSDGQPCTAADVVASWERAVAGDSVAGSVQQAARLAAAVEAHGARELTVRLAAGRWDAWPRFATRLPVVPRSAASGDRRDPGPGTGPYQLARDAAGRGHWVAGSHLDLVANPKSWHRQARPEAWNLAGMRLRFLADPAAKLAALRRQAIDWLAEGDVRALHAADEQVRSAYRVVAYDYAALGHYMVVWNLRRRPLADVRVRRALAHLFDRRAIADDLLGGDAVPAVAWFKPGMECYPADLQPPAPDPAAARALLAEAGYGGAGEPLRLEILGAAEAPLHRRILELAAPGFAAAGVELRSTIVEAGTLVQRLRDRDFDGILLLEYHEPWIDPYPHFHSSQAADGQNWMGLVDPVVDELVAAAGREPDAGKRTALYDRFNRRVHELQPVAFLVHPRAVLLLHRRFEAADPGPLGLVPERWWVATDRQLHR